MPLKLRLGCGRCSLKGTRIALPNSRSLMSSRWNHFRRFCQHRGYNVRPAPSTATVGCSFPTTQRQVAVFQTRSRSPSAPVVRVQKEASASRREHIAGLSETRNSSACLRSARQEKLGIYRFQRADNVPDVLKLAPQRKRGTVRQRQRQRQRRRRRRQTFMDTAAA